VKLHRTSSLPPGPGANRAAPKLKNPGYARSVLRVVVSRPLGVVSLTMVGAFVLVAILAPVLAPYGPNVQQVGPRLAFPGLSHWMGTDGFGRDILSRVIYGTRISLLVSVIAVTLGSVSGTLLGAVAGMFGRIADGVIMRSVDVLFAFPPILAGAVVVAIFGPGIISIGLAIAMINMPIFARLSRGEVLRERELDYVMAAECLGASRPRVLFYHILRNSLGPLIAQFAIAIGFAVLLESSLSFIGFGLPPPAPSWGNMLNDSRTYLRVMPWYGIFPGVALATVLVALNFLADVLRDAFDPQHRGMD